MAFAVLLHILCIVSYNSVSEQKHLIWLYRGASRIIYEGFRGAGGSIWSNVRTCPTYLERQAWGNSIDPDETPENVASDQGHIACHSSSNFYTILLVGYQMDLKRSIKWKVSGVDI